MKVAIVFEAPDELAKMGLSPEEFLRLYHERMFDIKLVGIDMPKPYNLAAQEGEKAVILVADSNECKCLVSDAPGIDAEEIKAHIAALQRVIQEQARVNEQEAIALQHYEMPEVKPIIDDSIRREARDRRQQHKLAVKFSNRRK